MQESSARHGPGNPLDVDKIGENLRSPFPKRKPTPIDAKLALLRWTDEMLKAGYPSARKGTPAAYDPMSSVAICLTAEELQAILTETRIAKSKRLCPRLEAMAVTKQAADLSVDDWGSILFALCGQTAHREAQVRKQLLLIARKIAKCLSEALGIDGPEG
jgi:hypothetical protein